MSIPIISTGVVNAPHWVYRLFYSIDYPVDTFVVFNNNGRDEITEELDALKKLPHKYIKNVKVCHLPANIGCSGYWNLTIKCFMNAPYWLIVNHDVMFTPGFLKAMHEKAQDPEVGVVHGDNGAWDVFLLEDWAVQKYGLFDENLYPAYCEDLDWGMRFQHDEDFKRVMSVGVPYYHGELTGSYADGSQTWRSEPELANKIHMAHELNKTYMHAKWSEAWQGHVEGKPYKNPFNNPAFPPCLTTYNLEFVRAKNLGF